MTLPKHQLINLYELLARYKLSEGCQHRGYI